MILANWGTGSHVFGLSFHPPGKPDKLRIEHLQRLSKPCLIVQGERDTFGNASEVAAYGLAPAVTVEYLTDGDHSFKPRKSSGILCFKTWHMLRQVLPILYGITQNNAILACCR